MARSGTDVPTSRSAVFLDRDGVINERAEGDYIRDWSQFTFKAGVLAALGSLHRAGAELFVVTNQRGVARGIVSASDLEEIHRRMSESLASAGAAVAGVFACPHEIGECDCRKPGIGLFEQARAANPWIDYSRSHVIGDSLSDLEAGSRIGATLWLVGDQHADVARQAAAHGLELSGAAPSLAELVAAGPLMKALRG